jgi:hypothetical protein
MKVGGLADESHWCEWLAALLFEFLRQLNHNAEILERPVCLLSLLRSTVQKDDERQSCF